MFRKASVGGRHSCRRSLCRSVRSAVSGRRVWARKRPPASRRDAGADVDDVQSFRFDTEKVYRGPRPRAVAASFPPPRFALARARERRHFRRFLATERSSQSSGVIEMIRRSIRPEFGYNGSAASPGLSTGPTDQATAERRRPSMTSSSSTSSSVDCRLD
jgi:hypothetical protein